MTNPGPPTSVPAKTYEVLSIKSAVLTIARSTSSLTVVVNTTNWSEQQNRG